MPDTDAPSRSESTAPAERTNLPVPIPQPAASVSNGENWFSRILRTLFGWKSGSIRDDLEVVLTTTTPIESGFTPQERTMLRNILALHERRVEDVMVPRADIVAVQADIMLGDLVKVFEGAGHSRLVVYNDTLDDPLGMAHIRDVVAFMAARAAAQGEKAKRKKPLPAGLDFKGVDLSAKLSDTKITRPLLYAPPSMPVIDLLAKMQATRIHLALVVDEYGGTDGIISIEDIVEQIVGEIEDEHDVEEGAAVVRQPDGTYLADARASLEEVTSTIGEAFDLKEFEEEVDTLAGFLVTKVGRVPVRGELVPGPEGFEIEVLDADPRRVKRVRIYRTKDRPVRARETRRRSGRMTAGSADGAGADQAVPDDTAAASKADPT